MGGFDGFHGQQGHADNTAYRQQPAVFSSPKACKGEEMKQTCGNCICYLDDTDENGNVTNYHHDRNKPTGFCAIQPLFTERKKDDKICSDYAYDKED